MCPVMRNTLTGFRAHARLMGKRRQAHPETLMSYVHLVGSIGLDTVPEIFQTAGSILGRRLKRVPDGEPGPRRLWASFQYPLLRSSPYLRPDPSGAVRATSRFPLLCLAEGVVESDLRFGELGYAREARASYQDFCTARAKGELAKGTRFQVCLPTPMGIIYAFCTPPDVVAIDRAYERAMIAEVAAICAAIPHEDLCIQWDFCHEMILLDGQPQDMFPTLAASFDEIMARMARICAPVPHGVELGVHLCYGDFGARHFIEPRDAGRMVDVANGLARAITRPLTYIHFPVPVSRTDEAFFTPFFGLKLAPGTEIYLGLIHMADGVDGVKTRLAQALKHTRVTGIATECGIARARKPELVSSILRLSADAAPEPPVT